ncbi:hypothetical protein [Gaoshiqia sp. Z1-71]|uniref:hypothetical protein n=1 Tax=Gaoshiqia hydrogeniformans TaxID=3290090 RepID=UPI003BF916B4
MSPGANWHINRVCTGVALASAAVIGFQIALMQVFSITQWSHFAHLTISLALLGFGTSGTFLYLFRQKLRDHFDTLFPVCLFLSSLSMATVTFLAHTEPFRFDTYLLFSTSRHWGKLAITCLLLLLPFFFGALAIAMSFLKYPESIGKIYFFNLSGSAVGGAVVLGLMWVTVPAALPPVLAVLPFAGALLNRNRSAAVRRMAWLAAPVLALMNFSSPALERSEYKSIRKTLLLPGALIEQQKSSPYGLAEVVSSPALRYAPGLSLQYQQDIPPRKAVFNNGDWLGALIPKPAEGDATILDHSTTVLPYIIQKPARVLILRSGTGEQIALARSHGVTQLDVVEPNRMINRLLKRELAVETDSLLYGEEIHLFQVEARTFLQSTHARYDLIQLPEIGSFFGSSGLGAVHPEFDRTREAFREMWKPLSPGGMISVTCWMDYPVRNPLKILATLSGLLDDEQLEDPQNHLVAIRSWAALTFVVKKTAFSETACDRIREFCRQMSFDPLHLPDGAGFVPDDYNKLDDPWFFESVRQVLSVQREAFLEQYPFRIKPATDNRPYFSQYIRLKSAGKLAALFGNQSVPFLELGYVVIILTFALLLSISFLLIILPLFFSAGKMSRTRWTLLYFGSIGFGYMFLEMIFIQQFTLYLGHPVYAATAAISILLLFSGIGSFLSSRLQPSGKSLFFLCFAVAAILLLYAFLLPDILRETIGYPVGLKILMMIIIAGIPGFAMGFPFPAGLTYLSSKYPNETPWAWAINGYASVIGTSLAVMISVETGFFWVWALAAGAYGLAAGVNLKRKPQAG